MKKRILALILITILVMTSLIGCTKEKESASTTTKVVLSEVAHSIFYAPMYVAIEKGYFAEEGIDLELVTAFGVITLLQDIAPSIIRLKVLFFHASRSDNDFFQHFGPQEESGFPSVPHSG